MNSPARHFSRRNFLSVAGLAPLAFSARAADSATEAPPAGLRVFTCGHSFHVWAARMIEDIAKKAGIKDHRVAGISSIGGSRVVQHWDVADEKNDAKKALTAGQVDVLTLSPIWLPDEGIENFAKLAFAHNPNVRVTVQEYWLPNDAYNPVYPLETRKFVDHNATDLAKLRDATLRYAKDIEDHVKGINQRLGKDAVLIVPVGMAAVTLREKIIKSEAPGLKQQSELFRDNWGHALLPLQLLSSYCHFAVIYRKSPVGLPLPLAFRTLEDMSDDDKTKLNTLLQQIAWDTVSAHPMSGIKK